MEIETNDAGGQEYASWRDVMLWERDTTCPDGYAHSLVAANPSNPPGWAALGGPPDENGMYWRCTRCDHHSPFPF